MLPLLSSHAVLECEQLAEQFNRECQCVTFSREKLRAELEKEPNGDDLFRMIVEERPHLFADSPVFIPEAYVRHQADIIGAVERVSALPAYQQRVLAYAPPAARFIPNARGVFLGYDFHLGVNGPQLIEINTNAGGALLNAVFARAQLACSDSEPMPGHWVLAPPLPPAGGGVSLEDQFVAMFREEWRLEREELPLHRIAIVDENPEDQFLYPEFLLFQRLFARHSLDTVICDSEELEFRCGVLWYRDQPIDLVYNRLTDFGFKEPRNRQLREAYLAGAAVVTPNPRTHALYADKRNLAVLTDASALDDIGVDAGDISILLTGIAPTETVRREDAERLWAARRRLFFKPAAGYGSKAAYRGDKLTRRVFEDILRNDYVAQALVPPSGRQIRVGGECLELKLDLRDYVYRGRVQLITTRLYQGQTTNFRTPGGGFAPVVTIPCREQARPLEGSCP